VPDLVLWYPGGQLGQVFVGDRYYIDKPVTLISTWDGEEVSLVRTHEHLRAAWRLDLAPAIAALDELLRASADELGGRIGGLGLYRTWTLPTAELAVRLVGAAAEQGLSLRRGRSDTVLFVPPLDVDPAVLRGAVADALRAARRGCAA
jgi:acetylornithine/succinyldiaminopimelate/putrescine aminotransferase